MKKKGFMGDYAFYFIYIFALTIAMIIIYMAYSNFNDGWQASDVPAISKTLASDAKGRFLQTWNWIIVMLVIGLFIGIVILAFAIRSHPAFTMLAVLTLIILGAVGVYLSNAYNSFATSTGILPFATEFAMPTFVMTRLPYFVIIFGFVFIIVLYAKQGDNSIV